MNKLIMQNNSKNEERFNLLASFLLRLEEERDCSHSKISTLECSLWTQTEHINWLQIGYVIVTILIL